MAGETLVAIQQQFNQSLVSGVTYAIANHPIIGWGGTFSLPKIIAGVALVIAVADLLTKLVDHKSFVTSFVKLVFYFVLVLANFGQVDHRSFLPIAEYVGNVDSENQAPPKEIEAIYKNNQENMPRRTSTPLLDRDLYNTVKSFFDSMADQLTGYQNAEDAAQEQKTAMYDTIFYLQQIRLARLKCVNEESDSSAYITCMKEYVPTSDPNPTNNPNAEVRESTSCGGQKCKGEADDYNKGATNEAGESSWSIASIAAQASEALTGVFHVIVAAIQMVYFIFSDFIMLVFFPVIMWLLEFIRNLVATYVLITIGFKAAAMLFFAKLMSPLILLDSKRAQVFGAYKSLFALAAFNFISQLFVVFSTIMAIGLKNAVYDNIAVSLLQGGTGAGATVDMTANIGTLTYLVYTGIFVVSLLQIMAIMKIEKACDALINFSVQEFVGIGRELAGSAVKIAMVASAGVMAAPALIAAPVVGAVAGAVTAGMGGMAAKAGALAGKIPGASKAMSAGRNIASRVGNSRAGSMLKQAGRTVGRKAVNTGERAADYFLGEESGDKLRNLLGKSGGGIPSGGGNAVDISAKKKNNNDLREDGDSDSEESTIKNKKSGGEDDNGSGSSSSGSQKGAKSKSGNNDNSNGSRSDSSEKSGKKKKGAAFLENPINKGILKGLKAFDAGLSMSEHISTKGLTGAFDATKRGYDTGTGLGNQVYKHQASAVKSSNKAMDELYADPESRSKIQAFNQGLDNVNDDVKMNTHGKIQEAINGQSMTEMDGASRREYWKTLDAANKGDDSEENLNSLYNLSQNNKLDDRQNKGLEKLLRSESSAGRHFAQRKAEEEKIVKKYANDPSINNASNLYNAYSEGQISKQTLASNAKDLSAQANKKYAESHDKVKKSIDSLDVEKYKKDNNYRNSKEAKEATAVMDNMAENEYLKTKLIGDKDMIDKMEALNKITEEEAAAMKKFESQGDLGSTIDGFKKELKHLDKNKSLKVDDNIEIRMHDDGLVMYDKQYQKTIKLEDGIKISQIKDKKMAENFEKYRNALTIIKNNPKEFIEKGIVSAESINRLDEILSYIED